MTYTIHTQLSAGSLTNLNLDQHIFSYPAASHTPSLPSCPRCEWPQVQAMVGEWMDCWGSVTCNHQWDALWAGLVCRVAKHDWKGVAGCGRLWGMGKAGRSTCTADHIARGGAGGVREASCSPSCLCLPSPLVMPFPGPLVSALSPTPALPTSLPPPCGPPLQALLTGSPTSPACSLTSSECWRCLWATRRGPPPSPAAPHPGASYASSCPWCVAGGEGVEGGGLLRLLSPCAADLPACFAALLNLLDLLSQTLVACSPWQARRRLRRLIGARHANACSHLFNPYRMTLLEPVHTNPPDPQFLAGEMSIAARTIVHLLKSTAERPRTEASSADALANVQHLVCLLEQYYHPSNTGERYRRGFIKRCYCCPHLRACILFPSFLQASGCVMHSHWHRALLPSPPYLPLPLLCVLQGDLSLPLRHSVPPFSDISPTLNAACFSPTPFSPRQVDARPVFTAEACNASVP